MSTRHQPAGAFLVPDITGKPTPGFPYAGHSQFHSLRHLTLAFAHCAVTLRQNLAHRFSAQSAQTSASAIASLKIFEVVAIQQRQRKTSMFLYIRAVLGATL